MIAINKWNLEKIWHKLAFLLAIIPAIFTGILIVKYSVNVPHWDQWGLAGMFEKIYAGNLKFQDLIAQHNESRFLFPRLLFIGLAYLTGWNVKYEMLVIFVLACIVSFNIYRLSLLTVAGSPVKLILLAGLSNLLIFSPIQYETLLWGMQLVVFAPIVCLTSCIVVAYSNLSLRIKILIGLILSTVATFSFANGLLCWMLAFPAIALAKPKAWQELLKEKYLIVSWGLGFIANAVIYFYNYRKPGHHPSLTEGLVHPVKALNYFLAYLGAPLAQNNLTLATIVGTILMVIFIAVGLYLVSFSHQNNLIHRTIGWLTIAGYTLISAAITTSGRVGFGIEQSLSSRYATFQIYLTVALVYMTAIILEDAASKKIIYRPSLIANRIVSSLVTVLILLHCITAAYAIEQMHDIQVQRYRGKACLLLINVVKDDDCLQVLFPNPDRIKPTARILNKMGFLKPGLVESNQIEKIKMSQGAGKNSGWLEKIERVGNSGYKVWGWAVLPKKKKPADGVILSYENKRGEAIAFAVASPAIKRKDVAKSLKNKAYTYAGWEKFIPWDKIPKAAGKVKAWALDADTGKAYQLNGYGSIAK